MRVSFTMQAEQDLSLVDMFVCVSKKVAVSLDSQEGSWLVPYSLASKDLVQTQAYKLSSIFILTSNIRNH